MNDTIETILKHRSIRSFTSEPLTEEQIQTIVTSAQHASTSSYLQAYSIIGVTDVEKKKGLAEIAGGQKYVEENGHFFVFCGDTLRNRELAEKYGQDVTRTSQSTEGMLIAVIDAALAAQNAAIAAESMGLGICYIGGLRNDLDAVCETLSIPKGVIPLFGMAVGTPANHSTQKPRLPQKAIYYENEYKTVTDYLDAVNKYDQEISTYYEKRTNGKRKDRWSEQVTKTMSAEKRMYMKDFFNRQSISRY